MTVKVVPMVSTAGNTGVKAKVFVGVSINAASVRFVGTGIVTKTRIGFGDRNGFMASELKTSRAVFTAADANKRKRGFIFGTKRSAVEVKIGMSGGRVTGIERNTDTGEVKIIFEG